MPDSGRRTEYEMITVTWNQLGPREKDVLAILRRAEGGLTSREMLGRLDSEGVDVAYTTVSSTLDRLAAKDVVCRVEETHAGSLRYRYSFEDDRHRGPLVDSIVDDVGVVLGTPGLELLARRAAEGRNVASTPNNDSTPPTQ
jgi:predicted transcriptional regulator